MDSGYAPNPLKRCLDSDPGPATTHSSTAVYADAILEEPSRQEFHGSDISSLGLDPLFALPMYTQDLGRLALHEPLNWAGNWSNFPDGVQLPEYNQDVVPSDSLFIDSAGMYLDLAFENSFLFTCCGRITRRFVCYVKRNSDGIRVRVESPFRNGYSSDFSWDDWGKYITNVEELMHSLENPKS